MLRFASCDKTYEVTIPVGGQPAVLQLRSLSLLDRIEVMDMLVKPADPLPPDATVADVMAHTRKHWESRFDTLARIVASIEGDGGVVQALGRMEHISDIHDIIHGIMPWIFLPEQESKNFCSSPEPVTPEPVGSATTSVRPGGGDV
jgi:hypothetical protein